MKQLNVLFIDSYDSFTFNLVRLIESQSTEDLPVHVTTIHNDTFTEIKDLEPYLDFFDCIIAGPGPGNPANGAVDVGILNTLFEDHESTKSIPILGVCLGFQALCVSLGASISQLNTIKHGQVYDMVRAEDKDPVFKDCPSHFKAVRYHSLHITGITNKDTQLEPLAFTNDENGQLLMAARAKRKPWYGVQYHPESCCSELGDLLIRNFLDFTNNCNQTSGRTTNVMHAKSNSVAKLVKLDQTIDRTPLLHNLSYKTPEQIYFKKYDIKLSPRDTFLIAEKFNIPKLIMGSATLSPNRGEWSIIALPNSESKVFTHYDSIGKTLIYRWQDPLVNMELLSNSLKRGIQSAHIEVREQTKSDFWYTITSFMEDKLLDSHHHIPFLGGLIGIMGYEMGLYVKTHKSDEFLKPDAKLVYVDNCIVINHNSNELHCISLKNNFPPDISIEIEELSHLGPGNCNWPQTLPRNLNYDIRMPDIDAYKIAFDKCQKYMHQGDSYEICLTTQSCVTPSNHLDPWQLFKILIQRNPAPFSSFLDFQDINDPEYEKYKLLLLSTSPERFLKWDRDSCELRPIKGTVKKGPEMSLELATQILKTPKEFGENLMILDLIRNDLHELVSDVKVEEFMSVEEYATVYQLVSVVKARGLTRNGNNFSGMDVLKHSLPPGSMTGAPKKSTVQLLQEKIEEPMHSGALAHGQRGIYSGVTGYWSTNGNGDWSVNIRCMYSYNGGESWQLGAGGAITVLSTLEGELEEMYTKLESALQVFI